MSNLMSLDDQTQQDLLKVAQEHGQGAMYYEFEKSLELGMKIRNVINDQKYGQLLAIDKKGSVIMLNDDESVSRFSRLYYDSGAWAQTYWLGHQVMKYPTDLILYQELIWKNDIDLIIETGTFNGGSALFFASIFDLMNNEGHVVTIDINKSEFLPQHQRITYIQGSSIDSDVINNIQQNFITNNKKCMVILDSDHTKDHVLTELQMYSHFVTKNCHIVAEDTNSRTVRNDIYGPMDAVEEFIKENKDFTYEKCADKFLLSASPRGILRRTA